MMIDRERLIRQFLTLSLIDGVSGRELDVATHLRAQLESLGLRTWMDDAGSTFGGNAGNVHARMDGTAAAPTILLCAHMDTVQPTMHLHHVREHGVIRTDGTTILGADDRAGIAVILELLEQLRSPGTVHGPIEVVFTVCEESGMHGAKCVARTDLNADYGLIFDSGTPPGHYVMEAPGAVAFTAVVHGRAAHAAVAPERGIHAIAVASRAIASMQLGRRDETGMVNVGTIRGGSAINIIPETVEITGETRNSDEARLQLQIEQIRSAFAAAAEGTGATVDLDFERKYGGFRLDDDAPVVEAVRRGIIEAGFTPVGMKNPGGSDANVLNANGIPSTNLGLGYHNAHSSQESLAEADLAAAAEIGLAIIRSAAH